MIQVIEASRAMKKVNRFLTKRYHKTNVTLLQKSTLLKVKKPFIEETLFPFPVYSVHGSNIHVVYIKGETYTFPGKEAHFTFLRRMHKYSHVSVHYINFEDDERNNAEKFLLKLLITLKKLMKRYNGSYYLFGDTTISTTLISISNLLSNLSGLCLISPVLDSTYEERAVDSFPFFTTSYLTKRIKELPTYIMPKTKVKVITGSLDLLHAQALAVEKTYPKIDLLIINGASHLAPLFPYAKDQNNVFLWLGDWLMQGGNVKDILD